MNKNTNLFIKIPRIIRLLLDRQLCSIEKSLKAYIHTHLTSKNLSILDYGSGEHPYNYLFKQVTVYKTLDISASADYQTKEEIHEDFNIILLIEVLEHISNPKDTIRELSKKLKPNGKIILSTPFNARIHRVPKDYYRYSIDFFEELKNIENVKKVNIQTRGNNFDTILNKLIYMQFKCFSSCVMFLPGLLILPLTLTFMLMTMLISKTPMDSCFRDDPLGFFVIIEF